MIWWTVQNTISAAVLVAAVTVICRLSRLRPAARHALWLLVLVKLVTPPLFAWPVALPDLAQRMSRSAAGWSLREPPVRHAVPDAERSWRIRSVDGGAGESGFHPAAPDEGASAPETVSETIGEGNLPASALSRSAPKRPLPAQVLHATGWFAAAWATGLVLLVVLHGVRILRMAGLVREARRAPKWLAREVGETAREIGVRPPISIISDRIHSPMIWALGRARLVCPQGLFDDLPATARRGVLIHELAHLRRRDHWVSWLELAGACVWWWNPLFWHVRRQLRENAELACDAWVVAALPEGRRAYAEALVAVYEFISESRVPVPVVGIGGGSRRAFERRLTMILRECVPSRLSPVGLLAVCVLAVVLIPAWAQEPRSSSDVLDGGTAASPTNPAGPELTLPGSANARRSAQTEAQLRKALAELRAEVARLRSSTSARRSPVAGLPSLGPTEQRALEQAVLQAEAARSQAEAEVVQRRSELEQVRAQQAEREALLRLRRAEYDRLAELADKSAVDSQSVEKAKYNLDAAKAGLEGGRAAIRTVEAQVTASLAGSEVAEELLEGARAQLSDARKAAQAARNAPTTPPPSRPRYGGATLRPTAPTSPPALPRSALHTETITLARTRYELSMPQAQALASLLQEHLATEVEARIQPPKNDDSNKVIITITTTPQAQQVIGQFIGLMRGGERRANREPTTHHVD